MTTVRKKKSNPTPVIVFGAIAVLALGGGAFWILGDAGRAKKEAEAAAKIVPTLPNGRLQLVSSTMSEALYVSLDDLKRAEDGTVSATLLKVGKTATSNEGG